MSRFSAAFVTSLRCAARVVALAGCACYAASGSAAAEVASAPAAAPIPQAATLFEQRVRPILVEHCQKCHGTRKQEGELRLDTREGLLKGGAGGAVVVPGDAGKSRLIAAVGYGNEDLQMPPDGPLTTDAVAALTEWVRAGAAWPADTATVTTRTAADLWKTHWAAQPVRAQPLPTVQKKDWPTSPIDYFILSKLERAGLSPSAPADRRTLLRRVTFDLLGLPPTEKEIADFEHSTAPDALERVVDRLLASPHYGERWGRLWLDVARYADTKEYVRLKEERRYLYAFTYRDYVVRAFNADLPYNQFVTEQLAADLLPASGDRSVLAALGFLTLGRQFTGNPHDVIDDRIDVVTRGLEGLTVTCARCHDHKYDPIPSADYYSLYGVFASTETPAVPQLLAAPASAEQRAHLHEAEARETALDTYQAQAHEKLLDEFRASAGAYLVAALEGRRSFLVPLPHEKGELRYFVAERWLDCIEAAARRRSPAFIPWHALAGIDGKKDFAVRAREVLASLDTPSASGPPANQLVLHALTVKQLASMADVARAYGDVFSDVYRRSKSGKPAATADEAELLDLIASPQSPTSVTPTEAVDFYLYELPVHEQIMALRAKLNEWLAQSRLEPPRAHVMVDRAVAVEPRVFVRGDPSRRGAVVPRQFLEAVAGDARRPFASGSGRLELAQAITDRRNPLTARVLVNRIWLAHFGSGIVRSPSNFGLRGEAPSHPELLDYLADRFMNEGWSIKKLHRWMVLSSTYGQSSAETPGSTEPSNSTVQAAMAADPENRLLWRMNRRRLDFESLRDAMLAAGNRLDLTVGGPPANLVQAENVRRTIYGLVDRQDLCSMFGTFDVASPDSHSPMRYATTVPQQALFLLNSPFILEQASAMAGRREVMAETGTGTRVRCLYRAALGRAADADEIENAASFIASGGTWPELAQVLLQSNEFAFVD